MRTTSSNRLTAVLDAATRQLITTNRYLIIRFDLFVSYCRSGITIGWLIRSRVETEKSGLRSQLNKGGRR